MTIVRPPLQFRFYAGPEVKGGWRQIIRTLFQRNTSDILSVSRKRRFLFCAWKKFAASFIRYKSELIETYIAIRDNWQKVESELRKHAKLHSDDYYYVVRQSSLKSPEKRAARFIYLNRTCFNGIYRVNRRGEFNVPRGSRDSVMLDTDDFSRIAQLLGKAELLSSDFEPILDLAKKGDFAFIDPPYALARNKEAFVKYNDRLFSWEDQVRLRDVALRLNPECRFSYHERR